MRIHMDQSKKQMEINSSTRIAGRVKICTFIFLIIILVMFPLALLDINNMLLYRFSKFDHFSTLPIKENQFEDCQNCSNARSMIAKISNRLRLTDVCHSSVICTIECSRGTLEEVIESINNVAINITCSSTYSIRLLRTQFPSNTINSGWLSGITITPNELQISMTDLKELGDEAFTGIPFNTTSINLIFKDTKIKQLRKKSFDGSLLASLTFDMFALGTGVTIEEDLLSSTDHLLKYISFTYSLTDVNALKNLIGKSSYFPQLEALYFQYNSLVYLDGYLFANTPNLVALYLSFSGLRDIDISAFEDLDHLQLLDISSNNLNTLTEGVFDPLPTSVRVNGLSNPWRCDCDLIWYQKFLKNRVIEYWPQCKEEDSWENMQTFEFCPEYLNTTSSTESTLPSTTTTSTTSSQILPDNSGYLLRTIYCRNSSNPSRRMDDPCVNPKTNLQKTVLKSRNIKYTISNVDDNPTYSVNLTGNLKSSDRLIWINVKNDGDYGCVYNINSPVEMQLSFGSTYTVCLASGEKEEESSMVTEDCTAFSTPTEWSEQTWLSNKQKFLVVLVTSASFFAAILVSIIVTYCAIKNIPKLVHKKKRKDGPRTWISVNTLPRPLEPTEVNRYCDRKPSDQSLITNVDGYLTPTLKNGKYSAQLYNRNYEDMEYVRKALANKYNRIYEAPPLPPNHPSELKKSKIHTI